MTFAEYWEVLMKRNPIGKCHWAVLSEQQFKKMQEQAYNKGFSEAESQRSLFESVFGKH